MTSKIHKFDNGVKVYDDQLIDAQRERYKKHNIHEAEEEPVFLESVRKMSEGSVYVNVGAAIGYYPLLIRTIRTDLSIVAYEPLKTHRDYFRKNIKLNGYKLSEFRIHTEGVYMENGKASFSANQYGSMIEKNPEIKGIFNKLFDFIKNNKIQTITLEKLYERIDAEIGLLQMDIQGLELDVIQSSEGFIKKHHIKSYIIGTHSEEIHRKCKSVFESCGYNITIDKFDTKYQPDGILVAEI